jgi:predicted PurR-regulated permease PerM
MWVAIFYLVLDEIMGDFVIPHIRASTMKIHPVSLLIMLLAMVTVFGLMGALIATPLTAFIKAYYEVFYEKKQSVSTLKRQIDLMLFRKVKSNESKTTVSEEKEDLVNNQVRR